MVKRLLSSIQGKLIGLYLLLVMLSLATLTYLFYQTSQAALLASVKSQLQTSIRNKAETISGWMREREHDVEVLSKNGMLIAQLAHLSELPNDAQASRRALRSLLKLVRDQYGAYHEISVLSPDGLVVASTTLTAEGRRVTSPAMRDAIRKGQRHVSDVRRYQDGPSLTLDICVPIEPEDSPTRGAVVVRVDLDVVNQMTSSMRLMQSGHVYLVDQRGVLITHRNHRRIFRENLSWVSGVKQVIQGTNGVGEYKSSHGVPVLGAYRWLPRWRWGLVAEVTQAEAFKPVSDARNQLFLISGLVAVVAFLGVLVIARQIVRPLNNLTQAVQAVASGKLDQHVETAGHDEIAYLTGWFNRMAESLTEAREAQDVRIREATASLAQRNEEIERANLELQRTNRELEQHRALVSHSARLAAMGEMSAGIAHEINNPLTTMKNLVHSMRVGPLTGDNQQDLAIIEEEIDKITKLVLNFLRYARPPKAKKAILEPNKLVTKTLDLLEPQINQKRITIRRSLSREVTPIFGDQEQLGQVYLNLVLNAIQAAPEDSEIEVFTRTVFGDGGSAPGRVELGVTDHGAGIRPGDRDRIFQPFFTTKAKGSGLGLAISQRIVEEHNGEVQFTSEPGVATTFLISLDVRKEGVDELAVDR